MSRTLSFLLILAVLDIAFGAGFVHVPESYFKASNVRKLEETATTGVAGYVIQTFFSDTKCGANAVSQIGYLSDSCITASASATTSIKYSFTKGDCSDLVMSYYSDGHCGTLMSSYPYSTFAMCNAMQSLGGNSMSGSCQVGTSYPKFPTSTTVNLVYPSADGCNDPAGTFEVFPLDTCMVAGNTASEYHCSGSITMDSYTTNSCSGTPSNSTTYPQACTKVINSSPQQYLKTYCN